MKVALLCFLLLLYTNGCQCRSAGPPIGTPQQMVQVCEQMLPGHTDMIAQPGNGGFLIRTNLTLNAAGTGFSYSAGQTYEITLIGTENTFRGFLIQARAISGEPGMFVGEFTLGNDQIQQTLACMDALGVPQPQATVTHNNPGRMDLTSTTVMWQAPSDADGEVAILFTVVEVFATYYVAISAAQALENPPTLPPPEPTPLPDAVTPPSLNTSDYRLTFSTPSGCILPNCTVYVGINPNAGDPTYLDFYVTGQAQVWAAVGFSESRNMFTTDVVGCYLNETSGLVEAVDTWNVVSVRRNELDSIQDTVLFNSTAENGTITCTFVRSIAGTTVGNEDRNLNSSLYVMYGVGNRIGNELAFLIHGFEPDALPTLSLQQFNPTLDSNDDVIVETPRDPEDYRLIFRTPEGCNVTNCTVFVGIDNNNVTDDFLDVYMTGETEAWLAVGFSDTRNMFSADVLACNLNPETGMVEVLDTWNVPANTRNNVVDVSQDVIVFNTSAADGRLTCVFARSIVGNGVFNVNDDTVEDLNLNASYWAMYGLRPADPVAGRLEVHNTAIPTLSSIRVNPTIDNVTNLPAVELPQGVVDARLAPEQNRLLIRDPVGCSPSQCDIFVGISTNPGNPDYLDFYIEGEAQGWVAIGFSDSPNMFDADVIGCNLNPNTGVVEALDTWNPASPTRGNIPDAVQDVFLFFGNAQDGRIQCSFTRLTTGSDLNDPVQDLDLNNDYFAMYGVRPDNPGANNFLPHVLGAGGNPTVSGQRFNPSVVQGEIGADNTRARLTRAHGVLMLIAWPLMAIMAIFFAAWMRPALPNGEWFQIHRFLMSGSIFVAVVGFILIFIANRNNSPPGLINLGSDNPIGTTHYVFGIVVMFLHLLNPLISICRCKPDDSKRWIFNIIHGTFVGLFAEILALTNVGLGLAIFSQGLSRFQDLTILYVYLGYLGFFLAMIFVLFILYTIIAYTSNDENRNKLAPSLVKPLVGGSSDTTGKVDVGVELAVTGTKGTSDPDTTPTKPKVPSKDSPIRWAAFLVFAVVVVLFTVVLIILVAIDG